MEMVSRRRVVVWLVGWYETLYVVVVAEFEGVAVRGVVDVAVAALAAVAGQAVSTEAVLHVTTSAPFSGTLMGRRASNYTSVR